MRTPFFGFFADEINRVMSVSDRKMPIGSSDLYTDHRTLQGNRRLCAAVGRLYWCLGCHTWVQVFGSVLST
jgi:hypothetical protein